LEMWNMRLVLLSFIILHVKICKIEAALEKGGVQYRLVDTLNCVQKKKSFLK